MRTLTIALFLLLVNPSPTTQISQEEEFLILTNSNRVEPWMPGGFCNQPGTTCEGWATGPHQGCLGTGGNPRDNRVTFRALPKFAGKEVDLVFHWIDDDGKHIEEWVNRIAPKRTSGGCGIPIGECTRGSESIPRPPPPPNSYCSDCHR